MRVETFDRYLIETVEVSVRGRIGLVLALHVLAEVVEDPPDGVLVQFLYSHEAVLERVSCYEAIGDRFSEAMFGDEPADALFAGGGQEQSVGHIQDDIHQLESRRPSYTSYVNDHLAILGCGKIGEILAEGLVTSGWRTSDQIYATARRDERVNELRSKHGFNATTSNVEAVRGASVLVLSVKPQDMDALLASISADLTAQHVIISIAAAIPTAFIEKRIPEDIPVVRAMPNAPSQVGEGIAAICPGTHANEDHLKVAEDVLSHVGRVVRLTEPYMDAVTAVSGSGPAYFALLAEAMVDAGIMLGLSRSISTDLVVQTMLGTAVMLRDGGMHPVELREAVTSPGGTTIMAIRELEQAGVRAALLNAIQAAMERSQTLAAGHE